MREQSVSGPAGNNFDFLRFFFASLVIFSHSYPLASGTEDFEPLSIYSGGRMTFGALAVDCFFIISGYLISQSWNFDPRARSFLTKRIRRIYPGFFVALTICAFVLTPMFSVQGAALIKPLFVAKFVGHALRLLDIYPGPAFQGNPAPGSVNGSLWSISYEFWCYLGVLGCGLVAVYKRPMILVIGLLGAMAVSFVFQWFNLNPGGKWLGVVIGYLPLWARLLPYFLVGMIFYSFRTRIIFNSAIAIAAAILLLIALRLPYVPIFLLPVGAAYLIFWFAFLPLGRLSRFAKNGDFSYGIYLYSFPILQVIAYLNGSKMAPMLMFCIAWPLAIAAGAGSWFGVERHFVLRKAMRGTKAAVHADAALLGSPASLKD